MIDFDNLRTSISGLLLAIGSGGGIVANVPEKYKWIFGILAFVGGVGLGYNAKDKQVHSTLSQVEQATKEEEAKK